MLIQILDVLLMNDAYHDNINDLYGIYDFSNEMVMFSVPHTLSC